MKLLLLSKGMKVNTELANALDRYVSAIRASYTGNLTFDVGVEFGRKYAKVVNISYGGGRSVHAFVDMKTGDVYMPATWNAPAKHVRFNLLNNFPTNITWSGGYLYLR
jgi:hypothetical protein